MTESSRNSETKTPFAKFDTGKLRLTQVPKILVKAVASVLAFGAAKYGWNNWQECSYEERWRYQDALERHWAEYLEGDWLDPESGMPHLHHVACNVMFLIWAEDKERNDQ